MTFVAEKESIASRSSRSSEQGWALLGLLLALTVMGIFLVSSIVPDVQKQVQRDKEVEMMYRGRQMAEGIARYYGNGLLQPLRYQMLLARPLNEIEKLRDGVTIGAIERKFVRPSALIDPMTGDEWQVVRARDPRLSKFLQAWLAGTQTVDITRYRDYFLLAGAPQKNAFKKNGLFTTNPIPGGEPQAQPSPSPSPPNQQVPQPPTPGNTRIRPPQNKGDDDDDDDDDDDSVSVDPLAGIKTGSLPIIGVAPKKKGKAMTAYFGLDNYEDWVFIYIPTVLQQIQVTPNNPGGRPRISQ
jgi:hypothetical protein